MLANMMKKLSLLLCLMPLTAAAASRPRLPTVDKVDLQRFMGSWYVIACIPASIEAKAYNAVETYRLDPNGTVDTVFTFNQGGFDGPPKRYNPRGFIVDKVNNSTWGMRFIWPFKSCWMSVLQRSAPAPLYPSIPSPASTRARSVRWIWACCLTVTPGWPMPWLKAFPA